MTPDEVPGRQNVDHGTVAKSRCLARGRPVTALRRSLHPAATTYPIPTSQSSHTTDGPERRPHSRGAMVAVGHHRCWSGRRLDRAGAFLAPWRSGSYCGSQVGSRRAGPLRRSAPAGHFDGVQVEPIPDGCRLRGLLAPGPASRRRISDLATSDRVRRASARRRGAFRALDRPRARGNRWSGRRRTSANTRRPAPAEEPAFGD